MKFCFSTYVCTNGDITWTLVSPNERVLGLERYQPQQWQCRQFGLACCWRSFPLQEVAVREWPIVVTVRCVVRVTHSSLSTHSRPVGLGRRYTNPQIYVFIYLARKIHNLTALEHKLQVILDWMKEFSYLYFYFYFYFIFIFGQERAHAW
jgi:hypothetical protein